MKQKMPRWRNPPEAGKQADLVAFGDRARQIKMVTLYVIKSTTKKFRYAGITNNLPDRIKRHNGRRNISTKKYAPFILLFNENFTDYKEARKREIFLKSGAGRKFLDSLKYLK